MINKSMFVIALMLCSLHLEAQQNNCNKNNVLNEKLQSLLNSDQHNRLKMQNASNTEIDSLWAFQTIIDNTNQATLIKLFDTYGFECVYNTNNRALETIISHSADSIRKAVFLPILLENLKKGIGSATTYANLYDQMLVYSGKEQLYGMVLCPGGVLCPIEDLQNINNRRLSIGLNTIEKHCELKGIPNPLDSKINIKLDDYSYQMMKGMYVPAASLIMKKLKERNIENSTKLDLWYNLACCFAHLTYYDEAKEALDSLVSYGYSDPYILGDYTFKELSQYSSNWNSNSSIIINNFKNEHRTIKNIDLSIQLRIMLAEDQSTIGLKNQELFKTIHQKHIETIQELFDKKTELSIRSIGINSVDAISTIILHEEDISIQKNLYDSIYSLSIKNEFPWENTCTVFDKIQVKLNKKQLYGTQWYLDPIDNKSKPYPIEDIENINKRRKEKGFKFTFEEYSTFQNSY